MASIADTRPTGLSWRRVTAVVATRDTLQKRLSVWLTLFHKKFFFFNILSREANYLQVTWALTISACAVSLILFNFSPCHGETRPHTCSLRNACFHFSNLFNLFCVSSREICGQKAVSLGSSCTFMLAWRVIFLMSLIGQHVRYESYWNLFFCDVSCPSVFSLCSLSFCA